MSTKPRASARRIRRSWEAGAPRARSRASPTRSEAVSTRCLSAARPRPSTPPAACTGSGGRTRAAQRAEGRPEVGHRAGRRRPLEKGAQGLDGLAGAAAERGHAMAAGHGHRVAVLQRAAPPSRAGAGRRRGGRPRRGSDRARSPPATAGRSARRARARRSDGRPADSRSTRKPARRSASSSAWTWTASTASRAVPSKSSTPWGREAGGTRRRAACSQPVAQRQPTSSSASRPSRAASVSSAGKQQLLDGALERAHGQALLHVAVGGVVVEALPGVEQARGGARPRASTAHELHRRGDGVGLDERAAQRLELLELVLAVSTGGAPGAGEAEAALPAPQGVHAHAEQLRRRVGPDRAHSFRTGSRPRG